MYMYLGAPLKFQVFLPHAHVQGGEVISRVCPLSSAVKTPVLSEVMNAFKLQQNLKNCLLSAFRFHKRLNLAFVVGINRNAYWMALGHAGLLCVSTFFTQLLIWYPCTAWTMIYMDPANTPLNGKSWKLASELWNPVRRCLFTVTSELSCIL